MAGPSTSAGSTFRSRSDGGTRGPRLGELLVGAGRLTTAELRKALKLQRELGGRLGTNLLELGILDEERLLAALGEQRRSSTVSAAELRQAHPAVVKSIPAKLARRYGIVPFALRGNTLQVACRDPTDVIIEDEVRMLTGYMMRSFLSLEVRIHEALELYYRAPPQVRIQALIRRLDGRREEPVDDADDRAAPSPATPSPRPAPARRGPAAEARERGRGPSPPPPPPTEPRFIELDAEEEALLRRSSADPSTWAPAFGEAAPATSMTTDPPPRPAEAATTPPPAEPPRAPEAAREEPALAQAIAEPAAASDEERLQDAARALRDVEIRDEIADVLLEFCAPYLQRRLLLIRRQGRIVGWRGAGEGVLDESVRAIEIPTDEPSVFSTVLERENFWLGPLPSLSANRPLVLGLAGQHPETCLVLPITVRSKLIGYLYGDNSGEGVAGAPLALLRRLLAKTSIAFEVYILKNKIRMI